MKKITLLFAVLLMAWGINAQTLNNPKMTNGTMIFKWDCAKDQFATSNDFEIDETVVFAVDVTGTPLEAWLTQAPVGVTRSIGYDFWTQWGGGNGALAGRFARIKGNIFGATINFVQQITSRQQQLAMLQGTTAPGTATTIGTVTQIYSNVLGFGYKGTDWGFEWWQLPIITAVSMTTSAYTGTKTSPVFYKSDYDTANFYPGGFIDWAGYAPPCARITTDVKSPTVSDSPIVGYEYYNLLGGKLLRQPESGFYIQKAIREDGTSTSTKIFSKIK